MTILRLRPLRPRWLNRVVGFPFFFNAMWIWAIRRAARGLGAEALVVADLPLAWTSVWVGKWLRIPVYYDMAEIYPEFLRSRWALNEMRWYDHFIRNPKAAEWVERRVLRAVTKVFVVSEESRERCLQLGVPEERVVVVGNTPEHVEQLGTASPIPLDLEPFVGRPILLFVGILIRDRGVFEAVQAMGLVVREVPDALLVIVGDGPERPRIEAAVRRLALQGNVLCLGWREHDRLPEYCAHAYAGLLPFLDGCHVRITLANKLFDYMAAGLPVVAADLPPMRRVLKETGAGVLFPPGKVSALAQGVVRLLRDGERRRDLAARGRRATLTKYRWSEDEKRFLAAIGS